MDFLKIGKEYEYFNKPIKGFVYIYSLSDPITNNIRYVGITKFKLLKRYREHIYDITIRNKINHKSNWIRKLLSKELLPVINIVDVVDYNEWQFWEKHYISLYKSFGFNLTNNTNGGDSVDGRKHSEETKLKIKKSNLGRKRPIDCFKHRRIKICQFEIDGRFIRTFESFLMAEKITGISNKTINKSCKIKTITAGGYSWCYYTDKDERELFLINSYIGLNGCKYISKHNLNGDLLYIYKSMKDASIDVKIPSANISRVIKGGRKTAKGFIWKFSTKHEYEKFHNL